MTAPAPRRRSRSWLAVLPLLVWPGYLFYLSRAPVPAFDSLIRDAGVVRESDEREGGRWGSDYVELEVFTGERLVELHVSGGLRDPIPQPGDSVVAWSARRGRINRVWQLDHDGRRVLSYERARRVAANGRRLGRALGWFALGTVAMLALLAGLASRAAPPSPTRSEP